MPNTLQVCLLILTNQPLKAKGAWRVRQREARQEVRADLNMHISIAYYDILYILCIHNFKDMCVHTHTYMYIYVCIRTYDSPYNLKWLDPQVLREHFPSWAAACRVFQDRLQPWAGFMLEGAPDLMTNTLRPFCGSCFGIKLRTLEPPWSFVQARNFSRMFFWGLWLHAGSLQGKVWGPKFDSPPSRLGKRTDLTIGLDMMGPVTAYSCCKIK